MKDILLLHPGQMGTSIGAALVANGVRVRWISAGRSVATTARATENGFVGEDSLDAVLKSAEAVFSICPPEAALDLAKEIHGTGFGGVFIDGNAVAPETARAISKLFGDRFVDGGIIGPPAWKPGTTRFFLSGVDAETVAGLFDGTPVEAKAISGVPGEASALKMAYAAWTKGGSALMLATVAMAERHGVTGHLFEEWDRSQPGATARAATAAKGNSPKAWRFVGEMREIEKTLEGAGLPGGFFDAAAETYQRLAGFRDDPQELDTVIARLLGQR